MKKASYSLALGSLALVGGLSLSPVASATVTGFVGNPTGNSTDFAAAVAGAGGTITTLDFNAHPLGALQSNFYAGVTLVGTDGFGNVTTGAGPGQGNDSSTPLSTGEGAHAASNYVGNAFTGSLTINFAAPVFGAGAFVVDLFNPCSGCSDLQVAAYTGANGSGALLGSFNAAQYNFQMNNLYYMGITSSAGDIGSLVFTEGGNSSGDTFGIDDIQIATVTNDGQVPEPASFALLGLGLAGLMGSRRRKL